MTDVTIENVLTDNLYNDLGFIVNNKLMFLIEAQSLYVIFTGNKGRKPDKIFLSKEFLRVRILTLK